MCSVCLFIPPCWADRELYAQWNSLSVVMQVVIPCRVSLGKLYMLINFSILTCP